MIAVRTGEDEPRLEQAKQRVRDALEALIPEVLASLPPSSRFAAAARLCDLGQRFQRATGERLADFEGDDRLDAVGGVPGPMEKPPAGDPAFPRLAITPEQLDGAEAALADLDRALESGDPEAVVEVIRRVSAALGRPDPVPPELETFEAFDRFMRDPDAGPLKL